MVFIENQIKYVIEFLYGKLPLRGRHLRFSWNSDLLTSLR